MESWSFKGLILGKTLAGFQKRERHIQEQYSNNYIAKVEGSLGGVAKSTLELCQLTIVEVHFSFLTLYLPKDTLYIYIFDVHLKIVL